MFAPEVMRDVSRWLVFYSKDLVPPESPDRIHSHAVGRDGAPRWAAEFAAWLDRDDFAPKADADESRVRTGRAMRRLRSLVIREYEVLWRLLVLGESVEEVQTWLNDRALRNGIPLPPGRASHYSEKDTYALIIAGVEFLNSVY